MRLSGRVAIVTGGARGIGKATCLSLAGEGASLVVLDYGGGVDGTGAGHGPADEVILDVYLKGTFVCTRAVAPVYREQRSGVVVNTSSESGLGNMGQANYSAAKEGITGFTRTIARDLGRYDCRANSIRPRAATRMTLSDELREAMQRARKEGMALGDGASGESPIAQIEAWVPEGVAAFTTWLCTDEAANVNGQDFIVSATEVSLMTQPTPERTIFTDDVWTVDELSSRMGSSVTRGLKNRFVPKKG